LTQLEPADDAVGAIKTGIGSFASGEDTNDCIFGDDVRNKIYEKMADIKLILPL
jgi:hypothetical protein